MLSNHTCRHDGYFVDLFVRVSNVVAIGMYKKVRAMGLQLAVRRAPAFWQGEVIFTPVD